MGNFLFIVLILCAILISYIADKKNKKIILFFTITIFSLVAGLRGTDVGIDTPFYNYAFLHNFPYSWQFEEIGFRTIANFIMNNFGDTRYIFCFFAIITNGLIILRLWDFREKCSMSVMLLLYSMTFYIDTMNIMRQFVAIAIIFYSTKLLEKNKYITFSLIVFGMVFIHSSSLLALAYIIIYLWNSLTTKKKILLFIPILLVCLFSIVYIVNYESGHITNYLSSDNSINNINITFMYRVVIFIISSSLLLSNKKLVFHSKTTNSNVAKKFDLEERKYKIVVYNYLVGLILCSMGMFYVVMARLGYFYAIFEVVYWGYVTKSSENKGLNFGLIFIYALYIFLLEFMTGGSGVMPFTFNV